MGMLTPPARPSPPCRSWDPVMPTPSQPSINLPRSIRTCYPPSPFFYPARHLFLVETRKALYSCVYWRRYSPRCSLRL